MTKLEALKALAEKVEAGAFDAVPGGAKSPMFNAFMDVAECAFGMYGPVALPRLSWDTYKGCLNSAKSLHEAVLPEWSVECVGQQTTGKWYARLDLPPLGDDNGVITRNAICSSSFDQHDPARAWLLAILKALIAQEEAA